jgi:hypothetical protein
MQYIFSVLSEMSDFLISDKCPPPDYFGMCHQYFFNFKPKTQLNVINPKQSIKKNLCKSASSASSVFLLRNWT